MCILFALLLLPSRAIYLHTVLASALGLCLSLDSVGPAHQSLLSDAPSDL